MHTVTSEHASGRSETRTDRNATALTGACAPNAKLCPSPKRTRKAGNAFTQNASSRNTNATKAQTAQTRIAERTDAPAASAATPPASVPATPATTVTPPSATSDRAGEPRSWA